MWHNGKEGYEDMIIKTMMKRKTKRHCEDDLRWGCAVEGRTGLRHSRVRLVHVESGELGWGDL